MPTYLIAADADVAESGRLRKDEHRQSRTAMLVIQSFGRSGRVITRLHPACDGLNMQPELRVLTVSDQLRSNQSWSIFEGVKHSFSGP